MEYKADYKVPGGKLIRAAVLVEDGRVLRARVFGDFFAHPEALFEEAEAGLADLPAEAVPGAAAAAFGRPDLVIFGVAPADIAEALSRALGSAPRP